MKKTVLLALWALLLAGLNARAQTGGAVFGLFGYAGATTGTTGGANGTSVTVNTGTALQAAINGKGSQPLTIYINGPITPANSPGLDKIEVKNKNDISIIGFATLGEFNGIGIKVFRANNIILQNLKVHHVLASMGDGDCISIEGPASHVWVDHCELYNVYQGVGVDDYDGLLDAKSDCEYLTFSWNYLHDAWKASLMGFSDTDNFDRKITYHHNRFENINSRLPLFRFGSGHVFNNYYKDIASTCINPRMGACVKIENNYFDNARNPYVTAYSAQDGFGEVVGNVLVNSPFVYASDVRVLPSCTATIPYAYAAVLSAAADVPALVQANAGVGVVGPTLAPGTYQVSTSVVGQGSVSPASGIYNQGQPLTLTATPAAGWQFAGWSGDTTTTTTNPLTFPVRRNRALTATFTQSTTPGPAGSVVRIEDSALPATGLCSFDGVVSNNSGADNGSVINLTNSSGRGITWKVEVAPAGSYQLKWRYVNSSASSAFTAKLSINGTEVNPAVAFARTANSTTFALSTLNVTLGPGVNEIRLETTQAASFADIDWLEVSGNRLIATNCANAVGTVTGVLATKGQAAVATVRAFPNPGREAFTFEVSLRRAGPVRAVLYAPTGARVAELLPAGQTLPAGTHQLRYRNPALPAGLYYYVLETGGETYSGKLLVQ